LFQYLVKAYWLMVSHYDKSTDGRKDHISNRNPEGETGWG
jgi:hypothetical protein